MWDLVGNFEDRFSHNEAHIGCSSLCRSVGLPQICMLIGNILQCFYRHWSLNEPRHEKTNILVSDQVQHKPEAVQLQKMARGLKFWI